MPSNRGHTNKFWVTALDTWDWNVTYMCFVISARDNQNRIQHMKHFQAWTAMPMSTIDCHWIWIVSHNTIPAKSKHTALHSEKLPTYEYKILTCPSQRKHQLFGVSASGLTSFFLKCFFALLRCFCVYQAGDREEKWILQMSRLSRLQSGATINCMFGFDFFKALTESWLPFGQLSYTWERVRWNWPLDS